MQRAVDKPNAFSLVELSIVLVILGLLAGGVLSGQALIRAAQLRSVSSDAQRFMAATYSFRDKYFAIPGDMSNASQFWGLWSTGGTPASVSGAKNGDGDGFIGSVDDSERLNYFRHLSLAGLIEGSYAGSYEEPVYTAVAGVNTPPSKLGGDARIYVNSRSGASRIYGQTGNYLLVEASASPFAAVLPEEAWNIDRKIDDGIPSSGVMLSIVGGALASRNCTTNDDWENAATGASTYRLNVTTKACGMLFFLR